jgi:hypothetical protein
MCTQDAKDVISWAKQSEEYEWYFSLALQAIDIGILACTGLSIFYFLLSLRMLYTDIYLALGWGPGCIQ